MADKKMVEQITSMEEDFAQWYTDVVLKAELIGYTSVKGCMAIKPAGYAIWELLQKQLDDRFKATGAECIHAFVHSGKPSGKREGPCGRLCTGSGVGNAWRASAFAGETLCTSDIRDSVL